MSIVERTAGGNGDVPSSVSIAATCSRSSASSPISRGTIVRRVSIGARSWSPNVSES